MPKEALEAAPRLLYFLSSCCLDFVGVGLCFVFYSWMTVIRIREDLGRRLGIRSRYVELMHGWKIRDRINGRKQRLWDYIADGRCELTSVETAKPPRPRQVTRVGSEVEEYTMPSSETSSSEDDVSMRAAPDDGLIWPEWNGYGFSEGFPWRDI